jgi:hypothetical protein
MASSAAIVGAAKKFIGSVHENLTSALLLLLLEFTFVDVERQAIGSPSTNVSSGRSSRLVPAMPASTSA